MFYILSTNDLSFVPVMLSFIDFCSKSVEAVYLFRWVLIIKFPSKIIKILEGNKAFDNFLFHVFEELLS